MSTPADSTDSGGWRGWIRDHVRLVVAAAAVAFVGLIVVLVWFQPQKLFLDDTVDEAFPAAPATSAAPTTTPAPTTTAPAATGPAETTAAPAPTTSSTTTTTTTTTSTTTTTAGPVLFTDGSFIDIGHPGSGIAQVYLLPDGSRVLRLEELDVSNGPDLRVILSTSPLVEDS